MRYEEKNLDSVIDLLATCPPHTCAMMSSNKVITCIYVPILVHKSQSMLC